MDSHLEQVLQKFAANGFEPHYFAERADAVAWLTAQVPAGESVSFGGSVTLTELGLREALEAAGVHYLDYRLTDLEPQELRERQRQVFQTHSYFLSANAITESGNIVNVDGTGNRLAASVYGPQNIYIVVGNNKLVANLDAAVERIEQVAAPQNCKRLEKKSLCYHTGKCEHCGPKSSICRAYLVLRYAPFGAKYHLVWIDEALGY